MMCSVSFSFPFIVVFCFSCFFHSANCIIIAFCESKGLYWFVKLIAVSKL